MLPLHSPTTKEEQWQNIRARLAATRSPQRPAWPSTLLSGGLPRGNLISVSGYGKTSWVVKLLAEQVASVQIAWLEKKFTLMPLALQIQGLSLDRVFFIEGKENTLWAATCILQSQVFSFLVLRSDGLDLKQLRRLQLLSEKSDCTTILLSDFVSNEWPVRMSLHIEQGQVYQKK